VNAYDADVASPVEVQEFWENTRELPGFAAGRKLRTSLSATRAFRSGRRPRRFIDETIAKVVRAPSG
jgi:hypothetical protein